MAQIIVLQFDPQTRSVSENLEYIRSRISSYHSSLVVLPELFLSSYRKYDFIANKDVRTVLTPLVELCRKNDLSFAGSLPVSTPKGNFNRGLYITEQGLRKKDKTRLFGDEQTSMTAGKDQPVLFYHDIAFSIQVCLDIIDPIVSRKVVKRGARLIINPATVSVDFLPVINKARALENNITTVFCNRSGSEADGTKYLGRSSVFHSDGTEETIRSDEGMLTFDL